MIDPHVEAVVVIAQGWRRDEVLKRNIAVWEGVKCSDRAANRIDEKIGNDAALEWLACKWISRNSKQALREVACALLRCRNVGYPSNAFTRTRAFVIGKEERAIAFDRTTERAAELVAKVLWFAFRCRREEVARIERSVTVKLE